MRRSCPWAQAQKIIVGIESYSATRSLSTAVSRAGPLANAYKEVVGLSCRNVRTYCKF